MIRVISEINTFVLVEIYPPLWMCRYLLTMLPMNSNKSILKIENKDKIVQISNIFMVLSDHQMIKWCVRPDLTSCM